MKKRTKHHRGLECLHCHARIFSMSVHHMLHCNCEYPKGVDVDGGFEYFKISFSNGWREGKDFKYIRMKV